MTVADNLQAIATQLATTHKQHQRNLERLANRNGHLTPEGLKPIAEAVRYGASRVKSLKQELHGLIEALP